MSCYLCSSYPLQLCNNEAHRGFILFYFYFICRKAGHPTFFLVGCADASCFSIATLVHNPSIFLTKSLLYTISNVESAVRQLSYGLLHVFQCQKFGFQVMMEVPPGILSPCSWSPILRNPWNLLFSQFLALLGVHFDRVIMKLH